MLYYDYHWIVEWTKIRMKKILYCISLKIYSASKFLEKKKMKSLILSFIWSFESNWKKKLKIGRKWIREIIYYAWEIRILYFM